jgi:hypothetical protein
MPRSRTFSAGLITTSFQPLWERGFRAFFLDNLDSYQRPVTTPEGRAAQVRGLAQIITDLHARFPGVKLLFNRGFELLPQVAPLAVGVVAESLFQGWDPGKKVYVEVSAQDRSGLLKELRIVRGPLPPTAGDHRLRSRARPRAAAYYCAADRLDGLHPVGYRALAGLGWDGLGRADSSADLGAVQRKPISAISVRTVMWRMRRFIARAQWCSSILATRSIMSMFGGLCPAAP